MHNRFSYMNPNMFLTWLIPLVVLLVIVLSVYMINRNKHNENRGSKESALDILDKRYANGEIDEEEYLNKKEQLKNR
jgi:putative membrane protein